MCIVRLLSPCWSILSNWPFLAFTSLYLSLGRKKEKKGRQMNRKPKHTLLFLIKCPVTRHYLEIKKFCVISLWFRLIFTTFRGSACLYFLCLSAPHSNLLESGVFAVILPPTEKWSSSIFLFPGLSFPAQTLTVQFLYPEKRNGDVHVSILKIGAGRHRWWCREENLTTKTLAYACGGLLLPSPR